MIYDGRNTAMAKCYNSIKHLVKKISFNKLHQKDKQQNSSTKSRQKCGYTDLGWICCVYREHI